MCVLCPQKNRMVKGERSEKGIQWINRRNNIWTAVFVTSNFTFLLFLCVSWISFHLITNRPDIRNARHMQRAVPRESWPPALQPAWLTPRSAACNTCRACDTVTSQSGGEQVTSKVCEWNDEMPSGYFPKAFDFKKLFLFWFYYLASYSFTKNVW